MSSQQLNVTVWNEFRHEKNKDEVRVIYPDGMHHVIGTALSASNDIHVRTATLDEPEHGLTDEVLQSTDVLIWWGHGAHKEVQDAIVEKVYDRVLHGMGMVVLHSGHFSKIFKKLMGTSCNLKWRVADEKERVWTIDPSHPITQGIPEYFEIPQSEMYGERFDIPQPDQLVFVSWFAGGNIFRSGCCYHRGMGKIFYFSPGHESNPIYHDPVVQRVITNGVRWAAPLHGPAPQFGKSKPALEKLD